MDDRLKALMPTLRYMMYMRPVFNTRALFSDETENYISPMEAKPFETVHIRFRTAADNVDQVFLISGSMKLRMRIEKQTEWFDYYTVDVKLEDTPMHYYFEVQAGNTRCFYNKCGVTKDLQESRSFCIVPGFSTPDWAKGAVMYQIFTDRFRNGDPSDDVEDHEYVYINGYSSRVRDWNKIPELMGGREFYGGDLQGVMDKLDYLKDLGIEVIYFNPLFVSPSNHKYDIQDYDYIDPHFGKIVRDEGNPVTDGRMDNRAATKYISRVTSYENLNASNELFSKLVKEAHKRGIRVIIDGVFNHCGSFNKWMDRERIYEFQEGYEKGAYVSADSPYRSFFRFFNEHEWPYNEYYEGWWGHNTLPKLNYEDSGKLEEYILGIAKKWVSPPYDADGWRLDVAADLGFSAEYNHAFWKKFRNAVKSVKPDALILAEHYGDPAAWLKGDEWDTIMNYDAFMEPATWFFTGMEKHSDSFQDDLLGNSDAFISAMTYHMSRMMGPSLLTSMNELSNHDHSRFLTRTNHKVGRVAELGGLAAEEYVCPAVMREAVVMQMTWPGAPTVYYGDEAGVCGFTDPDNRRTYPWGSEDKEMLTFHALAIRMHKKYPVFTGGSLIFLTHETDCLSYGRFNDEMQAVIVFNNGKTEKTLKIPVWMAGVRGGDVLRRVLLTDEKGFIGESTMHYRSERGEISVTMPPLSAMVLVSRASQTAG